MEFQTPQTDVWNGRFGRDYTDRNPHSLEELQALYKKNYGTTRIELNERFLQGLDRSIRILEVGSGLGMQLLCLQSMGFGNLYGVELQEYAVEESKAETRGINIIQGTAFDIPFKDGYFDLVYTSGVLIHIHPDDLAAAMGEIYRCTGRHIWGLEYFADTCTEVEYRGNENLLWKNDFARLYLDRLSDLELVQEERIKYQDVDNQDAMFLLRKAGAG